MSEHVVIIDPDPLLAKSIQERLGKSFSDIHFQIVSPEECLTHESGSLTADIIFYDQNALKEETLKLLLKDSSTETIPLNAEGFPPRKKDALELSDCLSRSSKYSVSSNDDPIKSSFPSGSADHSSPDHIALTSNNRSRMVLSFTDPIRREAYISGCIRNMTQNGHRLIRVDLMPGISMRNPFRKRSEFRERNSFSFTGISEVLLKLESTILSAEELLQYVQLGIDGVYSFGLPDRSDDILDCKCETLLCLLRLLRKLADQGDRNFSVLTVVEGLPFHSLRNLCPYSEELHVLMPDETISDRNLAEWEIHRLFSSLPPSMLKFVSEPQRGKV